MRTAAAHVARMARVSGGSFRAEDFQLAVAPLTEPRRGAVLVQKTWMSVDLYMRAVLQACIRRPGSGTSWRALQRLLLSRSPRLRTRRKGARAPSQNGWRDRFVAAAGELTRAPQSPPFQAWLGVLGLPGSPPSPASNAR